MNERTYSQEEFDGAIKLETRHWLAVPQSVTSTSMWVGWS